jgi:hypothetical protein
MTLLCLLKGSTATQGICGVVGRETTFVFDDVGSMRIGGALEVGSWTFGFRTFGWLKISWTIPVLLQVGSKFTPIMKNKFTQSLHVKIQ